MGAPVQAEDAMITCVTCGLTYSVSQGRDSCARCPLHEDCSTSCCPKCGTSNINPDKSRLARWLERTLQRADRWLPAGRSVSEPVEAQSSSSKIRPLDFGVAQHPVERLEGVPDAALRQAQGTDEGLNSSHKIRTMDFGGGGEGVSDAALRQAQGAKKQRTLADIQPGREVQITGYGELNSSQRQHLQAYGLLPGRRVQVLSQHPVTIVQVEQTELAFERGIATRVLVGD